jgi:hypothetical protein
VPEGPEEGQVKALSFRADSKGFTSIVMLSAAISRVGRKGVCPVHSVKRIVEAAAQETRAAIARV